jgi:hypothetical protein
MVRKAGIVLGGAVLTAAALFLLGAATSLVGDMGWIHLGENQPWLPLIGLEYGFPLESLSVPLSHRKGFEPDLTGVLSEIACERQLRYDVPIDKGAA